MQVHLYEVIDKNDETVYVIVNEDDKWTCYGKGDRTLGRIRWTKDVHCAFLRKDKSVEMIAKDLELKQALKLVAMHLLLTA